MRVGAVLATGTNILLLTFFVFQSFQSPFGRRHLAQITQMMDLQKQNLMAAEEHFKLGNPSAESFFKPWIKKDLSTWAQDGINEVSASLVPVFSECLGQSTGEAQNARHNIGWQESLQPSHHSSPCTTP